MPFQLLKVISLNMFLKRERDKLAVSLQDERAVEDLYLLITLDIPK